MAESYRSHSSRSDTPSSSSGGSRHGTPGQYPATVYPSGQHSYYSTTPVTSQHGISYGYRTSQSPPQFDDYVPGNGHRRSSGGTGTTLRHSSHSGPIAPEFTSERASKRPRATTTSAQAHMQTDAPAHVYHYQSAHQSRKSDRDSSGSSGYNSPGYSHGGPHDSYGQQAFQPSLLPSPGHMYDKHVRRPSSDDEYAEHGPSELPPRTFSGKSPYDQPKKPGKIPGSAMDYLPILEARFDRLETAIDKYVDFRGQRALSNSILPGLDSSEASYNRKSSSSSSHNLRGPVRR